MTRFNPAVPHRLPAVLAGLLALVMPSTARAVEANIAPQPPRYEVVLTSDEYPPFQTAAEYGVKRYHAEANFAVRMALSNGNVVYVINVVDPKLLEIWSTGLAETSSAIVKQLGARKPDQSTSQIMMNVVSARSKVDQAKTRPVWDPLTLMGRIAEQDGKLFLTTDAGDLEITGNQVADLKARTGKSVYAAGYLKVKGQFEVARFIDRRENTLELFVMSHCPFGKQAEAQLLNKLKASGSTPPFGLNIHYIIYRKDENGKPVYSSLHGPDELDEDVVQMTIRDRYPKYFNAYVLSRVMSEDPWQKLAADAGMDAAAIADVGQHARTDRDKLIESEYRYATDTYQITNGSPTFVWESVRVEDPNTIPALKGLTFLKDTCSGDSNKPAGTAASGTR